MLTVGNQFPSFNMLGVNDTDTIINVDILLKEWTVMYFYPKDFTFICPADNEFCKLAWKQQNGDIRNITHVLCADAGLKLGRKLGIVDEDNGVHYRATFIIDPEGVIQHVSVNALDTGRNADEILRTLQALQAGGLTGCSWQPGDEFVA
jgi:alkyl hydroperoxide reductase subunit AhpC